MPNLYGATPAKDRADFARFFDDPAIRPDELKIYPCSLIAETELYDLWQAGHYQPYTETELVELLADVKPTIPPYTRVNRLFRDIPAHHIQAGVKLSNLRQVVHDEFGALGPGVWLYSLPRDQATRSHRRRAGIKHSQL
ncbi:MAG: hypothetical protein R2867_22425 [Caldilineaceae bacterium]